MVQGLRYEATWSLWPRAERPAPRSGRLQARAPAWGERRHHFRYRGLRRDPHLVADWQHFISVNAPVPTVLDEGEAAAFILGQERWASAGGGGYTFVSDEI
jgi:hypothetical protein